MAIVSKTSPKGANPRFPAKTSPGVKVAEDGGHNLGTPTHCVAERAHRNVKSY